MCETANRTLEIVYDGSLLRIGCHVRSGGEPAIVYLHGLGCSKDDFLGAFEAAELCERTLVAFDFPGCGDSPYLDMRALTMDDLVEISHLVVLKLRLNAFVMVGHSMGGAIAVLYAKRFPESVLGLINVEGNLGPEDCFLSRKVVGKSLEDVRTMLRELAERLETSANFLVVAYARRLKEASVKAYADHSRSLVLQSDAGDLLNHFLAFRHPKVFLYGSEDAKSLPYLEALKTGDCPIVEIPNSGHFPGHDNPAHYYRSIAEFVERMRQDNRMT